MHCEKKKVCYLCHAPFKMERGCNLEKRCPACRELRVQRGDRQPYHMVDMKVQRKTENYSVFIKYCAPEETYILEEIAMIDPNNELFVGAGTADDPIKEMERTVIAETIEDVMGTLTYNEAYVLRRVTMEDAQLTEVALELSLGRERVRQINSSAIKKLKHPKIGRALLYAMNGEPTYKVDKAVRPLSEPVRLPKAPRPKPIPLKMGPNQDLLANWVR